MSLFNEWQTLETRRRFFARGRNVVGYAALSSLLGETLLGRAQAGSGQVTTHFPAKAKRVIYLHMVGGPSQMDLFDYKPGMQKWYDKDLPDSIRQGQRLTTMTSGQAVEVPLRAARPVRHVDERRPAAAPRQGGR